MSNKHKNLAKIHKALSDENRLSILSLIHEKDYLRKQLKTKCEDAACIKDISKVLNITLPTISHHIKELVNAGIVSTQKKGKWVYCKINKNTLVKTCEFSLDLVKDRK